MITPIRSRSLLLATTSLILTTTSISCLDVETEPTITSVNITPNTVPKSATGMTDEFFTVTITTSGFSTALTGATVSIQEIDLAAEPGNVVINGDVITLEQISTSWAGGLEEGVYNIEATVISEGTELNQKNMATVTVTAN